MPRWHSRITAFLLALLSAGVLSLTTLPGALASAASQATNGAQASSTSRFHLINEDGWCLHDAGHNNVMNTSAQPCATYFTLTFAGNFSGFNWYYMHINGGSECLNYVARIGGWVADDSCVSGDGNELWEH